MKELNDEIVLTLNLMQTDIDDGAHSELQSHLYSLLEMKRSELQKGLVECKIEYVAQDPTPYKGAIPLLTTEELEAGGWWCADVSKECADALKSKGLRVLNSDEWGIGVNLVGCGLDDLGSVTRCIFDFEGEKQIKRIGNDFYWSKP